MYTNTIHQASPLSALSTSPYFTYFRSAISVVPDQSLRSAAEESEPECVSE